MNEVEFKSQTKAVALRVIKLVEALPRGRTADVFGRPERKPSTAWKTSWPGMKPPGNRMSICPETGSLELRLGSGDNRTVREAPIVLVETPSVPS